MSKMGSTYSICWYQGLSCLARLGNNHSNRGRETPLYDGHRPTAPSFTLSGYHRTRRQVGTKNNKYRYYYHLLVLMFKCTSAKGRAAAKRFSPQPKAVLNTAATVVYPGNNKNTQSCLTSPHPHAQHTHKHTKKQPQFTYTGCFLPPTSKRAASISFRHLAVSSSLAAATASATAASASATAASVASAAFACIASRSSLPARSASATVSSKRWVSATVDSLSRSTSFSNAAGVERSVSIRKSGSREEGRVKLFREAEKTWLTATEADNTDLLPPGDRSSHYAPALLFFQISYSPSQRHASNLGEVDTPRTLWPPAVPRVGTKNTHKNTSTRGADLLSPAPSSRGRSRRPSPAQRLLSPAQPAPATPAWPQARSWPASPPPQPWQPQLGSPGLTARGQSEGEGRGGERGRSDRP